MPIGLSCQVVIVIKLTVKEKLNQRVAFIK